MSSEIIGLVSQQEGSESLGFDRPPAVDRDWVRTFSRAHEEAGFDRVLIGYSSTGPDGFALASSILHNTERLKVLIAHRPGFIAPTLEARKLATLDALAGGGRVAIHHISGGSDQDQARDGDYLTKDERYERTAEFIQVLRRTLTSESPFDYRGNHYRVDGAFSTIRPDIDIPIFIGGQSDAAIRVGAEHADTFAFYGEPLAETAERIDLIQAEAAKHGRSLDFSLSTRPIVADTEQAAWERADEIARQIESNYAGHDASARERSHVRSDNNAVSRARLQSIASSSEVHDERLWFGATKRAGLGGNSSGHVGTAAQVADALIQYWDLGVRKFLIRGFDPLADVRTWGDGLVPELRARIAEREARAVSAA